MEFSVDLPIFPQSAGMSGPFLNRHQRNILFDRECLSDNYAASMAAENLGSTPLEFSRSPFEVYSEFLLELVCIPGFIAIRAADRYCLSVSTGRHFDARITSQRIAQLVQRHFYPDEETIELEIAQTIPPAVQR